ncbi:hypothetical protein QZH41_013920, partial [Actinostola sp. cb2023]
DYGTADGGTSMPLMYACVKAIREKYGQELPINIIYEDQPVNDFKSLFMRLQGLIPGPPSYLVDFTNVFVLASGTNYYDLLKQTRVQASVLLRQTTRYLVVRRSKTEAWTRVCFRRLVFNEIPEENEKFRQQAAKDWERILLHRAAELVPGAKMVLAMIAFDRQWFFEESSRSNMFHLLSILWKAFADEGIITE